MMEWTAVTAPVNSAITGYMLEIDDGLDGEYSTVYDGTSTPSKFNYTAEGLTAQTTYRLRAFAVNKAGNGTYSTVITCFTATIPG